MLNVYFLILVLKGLGITLYLSSFILVLCKDHNIILYLEVYTPSVGNAEWFIPV